MRHAVGPARALGTPPFARAPAARCRRSGRPPPAPLPPHAAGCVRTGRRGARVPMAGAVSSRRPTSPWRQERTRHTRIGEAWQAPPFPAVCSASRCYSAQHTVPVQYCVCVSRPTRA